MTDIIFKVVKRHFTNIDVFNGLKIDNCKMSFLESMNEIFTGNCKNINFVKLNNIIRTLIISDNEEFVKVLVSIFDIYSKKFYDNIKTIDVKDFNKQFITKYKDFMARVSLVRKLLYNFYDCLMFENGKYVYGTCFNFVFYKNVINNPINGKYLYQLFSENMNVSDTEIIIDIINIYHYFIDSKDYCAGIDKLNPYLIIDSNVIQKLILFTFNSKINKNKKVLSVCKYFISSIDKNMFYDIYLKELRFRLLNKNVNIGFEEEILKCFISDDEQTILMKQLIYEIKINKKLFPSTETRVNIISPIWNKELSNVTLTIPHILQPIVNEIDKTSRNCEFFNNKENTYDFNESTITFEMKFSKDTYTFKSNLTQFITLSIINEYDNISVPELVSKLGTISLNQLSTILNSFIFCNNLINHNASKTNDPNMCFSINKEFTSSEKIINLINSLEQVKELKPEDVPDDNEETEEIKEFEEIEEIEDDRMEKVNVEIENVDHTESRKEPIVVHENIEVKKEQIIEHQNVSEKINDIELQKEQIIEHQNVFEKVNKKINDIELQKEPLVEQQIVSENENIEVKKEQIIEHQIVSEKANEKINDIELQKEPLVEQQIVHENENIEVKKEQIIEQQIIQENSELQKEPIEELKVEPTKEEPIKTEHVEVEPVEEPKRKIIITEKIKYTPKNMKPRKRKNM